MKYDAVALGRRIAALRKNMNCSQMEFSEMLFVNRGYLSQIEIGHRKPSLELIVDIADLTGADMNYLVLGKGQSDSIKTELRTVIDMLNAIDERL
ncbi:MAG: helix-turn-helix transcriptional regulator [Clostridia bacterium]|nr:helix-turn-helix transcriptional regulator [Clostridia bacterium]